MNPIRSISQTLLFQLHNTQTQNNTPELNNNSSLTLTIQRLNNNIIPTGLITSITHITHPKPIILINQLHEQRNKISTQHRAQHR
jgi:hypothetical protein